MNDSNTKESEQSLTNDCFTAIYLRQFDASITSETINTLIGMGFERKNTLLSLDLIALTRIHSIDLPQKRLLNVALHNLRHNKTFPDRKRAVDDEDKDKESKKFKIEDNKENVTLMALKSHIKKPLKPLTKRKIKSSKQENNSKNVNNNKQNDSNKKNINKELTKESNEELVKESNEESIEYSVKESVETSNETSVVESIEKSIERSVEDSIEESVKESIEEPAKELETMFDNNDSGIRSNDSTQSDDIDSNCGEDLDESVRELSEIPLYTLEALIIKGCFLNFERKSTLIKEMSKYCPKSFTLIELLVRNLTAYDLTAEKHTIDAILQKCLNLKCLRLSYCKVNVKTMTSLKAIPDLQCLHLEYIYGIDSAQEWTEIGKSLNHKLYSLSINGKSIGQDITGMLSKLSSLSQLSLEEYKDSAVKLFSSISPNIYQLFLNNYHNIDVKAIEVLAKRLSQFLTELELVYDSYDSSRANANQLFAAICELISELKVLKFKTISMTNMRPLFKAKNLFELSLQFSVQKFIDFPEFYTLRSLRNLSLTHMYLTPRRMHSMAKAFPYLESLSLSAPPNRHHIDSSMFCCECRNKDKTYDNCLLCYENCGFALIELTYLKVLRLNYIRVRSSLAKVFLYIPKLQRLVVNPFDCQCGYALLMTSIKVAKLRKFILEIRKCFIDDELLRGEILPKSLQIVYYNQFNDK